MLQQIALGGTMIALPIFLQMVLEYNAMQAGLSHRAAVAEHVRVALLAGKRSGDAAPGSIIRAGFALLIASACSSSCPIVPASRLRLVAA